MPHDNLGVGCKRLCRMECAVVLECVCADRSAAWSICYTNVLEGRLQYRLLVGKHNFHFDIIKKNQPIDYTSKRGVCMSSIEALNGNEMTTHGFCLPVFCMG